MNKRLLEYKVWRDKRKRIYYPNPKNLTAGCIPALPKYGFTPKEQYDYPAPIISYWNGIPIIEDAVKAWNCGESQF